MQHYCRFKGGEYRLFDPDDLKAHYFGGLTLPAKPFTLYTPVSFKTMIDDLHLFKVKHKYMIDNFAFRYLVIEEESNRCSAERTLAKYIGSEWLISSVPYGGDDKIDTELKKLCA